MKDTFCFNPKQLAHQREMYRCLKKYSFIPGLKFREAHKRTKQPNRHIFKPVYSETGYT